MAGSGDGGNDAIHLPVVLPEHPTSEPDAYLCTSVPLPDRPLKLVGIASNSDQRVVHHMLLFGERRPDCPRLPPPRVHPPPCACERGV